MKSTRPRSPFPDSLWGPVILLSNLNHWYLRLNTANQCKGTSNEFPLRLLDTVLMLPPLWEEDGRSVISQDSTLSSAKIMNAKYLTLHDA
jgi:hypothetical protein